MNYNCDKCGKRLNDILEKVEHILHECEEKGINGYYATASSGSAASGIAQIDDASICKEKARYKDKVTM